MHSLVLKFQNLYQISLHRRNQKRSEQTLKNHYDDPSKDFSNYYSFQHQTISCLNQNANEKADSSNKYREISQDKNSKLMKKRNLAITRLNQ